MSQLFTALLFFVSVAISSAQSTGSSIESIRLQYNIPELSYAVVSSDSILALEYGGVTRINTNHKAQLTDRFRIGSITKAITGFIAALLVKEGKIKWDTKFFDLFPELKTTSNKAYHQLTLLNLLTFRAPLSAYTYTNPVPTKEQFSGDEAAQRYQFTKWFFQQPAYNNNKGIVHSNLGFVAAGLMLEKASGKPYKQLVTDLGERIGISFGFGQPNSTDSLQPWGHNEDLQPEPPGDNYKLGWLLAAGNINVSLPDYAKFIQLQLRGLQGRSDLLTKQEFEFLHYGLPQFSVGWFREKDKKGRPYSYNIGNPGTFLSRVYVFGAADRGFILFANVQSEEAERGMDVLFDALSKKYNR